MLASLRGAMKKYELPNAFSADNINGKIQGAEQMKIYTMFVIGKRDMEAEGDSMRARERQTRRKTARRIDRQHLAVDSRA
jgi:threonyl-tRNA synthetase